MEDVEKNISALTSSNLIHSYELNGSLTDSVGSTPLIGFGGNITSNGYVFGRNQGLSLTGALSNIENYTIIVDITFNTLGPAAWQRILDFKNRTSDYGLYVFNSGGNHGLQFYPYSGIVGTVTAGKRCRYIITRSSNGQVKTYVDNSAQFVFDDSIRRSAVADNNILLFCIDDFMVPNETDSGTIHKIEIYSVPLTEGILPTLPPTPTPTPTPIISTPTLTTPTPTLTNPSITPTPDGCDRVMVFSICNANAAKDDNFEIYLNDHLIGVADLSIDDLIGSVFIANNNPNLIITEPDFACPLSKMVKYNFDPSFVIEGTNTVKMKNIQLNNNGNWGILGIRNYSLNGTNLTSPCYINNLNYAGGTGEDFNFTFEYNQCCYEDPGAPTTCDIPCFNLKLIKSGDNVWEGTDDSGNKITVDMGSDDLTISDSKGLAYWNKTVTNWKSNIVDGVISIPGCEKIKIGGFCDAGNNDCVEIFEQGFIGDNQEGNIRRYSWNEDKGFFYKDGSSVVKSPWSINGNKIRIDFENDINCEKYNKNIQKSTCKLYLQLAYATNVTIGWEGKAEVQDSCYEQMQIKINGSKVILGHSVGGNKGCDPVEEIVSVPLNPYSKILPKGLNIIEISVDTIDPLYHSGAYYEFTIDPFSCCKCSLEILDVIEKETLEDGSKVYEVRVKNDSGNCCGLEFKSRDGTWIQVPSDKLDCSLLASDNKIIATLLDSWVACPTPTPTPTSDCVIWSSGSGDNEKISTNDGEITVFETDTRPWRNAFCYDNMTCDDKPLNGSDYKLGWWVGDKTFTFSQPVTNPVLAIFELGNIGSDFIEYISISSSVPCQIYCNSTTGDACESNISSGGIYQINSNTIGGQSGYGIIIFPGIHSSITLSMSSNSDSGSYKWGTSCIVPPMPSTPTPTPTTTTEEAVYFFLNSKSTENFIEW
jgi:hypothetical protein